MSGGFFRGTSADQDTRFSNKQAKLLKSQKFAPELDHLVDMSKVKMDVVKPWIATRVTELLGFEDEVLINFIYGLLDGKDINGKEVQIQLTGFMEKNTGKFMKELWGLLISAEKNASGVPQQFLDAKEEEIRKKKEEAARITVEIQKKREIEQERIKKMDREVEMTRSLPDPTSKNMPPRDSGAHKGEDKEAEERNGSRGRNRLSRSPRSADRAHSSELSSPRSNSKPPSNSSGRKKSRSISRSPPRRRSISPERRYRSPRKRSMSPRRRHSPRRHRSPFRRRSPYSRQRSSSIGRRRSPFPSRRRSRSPLRRRSPSPIRRRSPPPPRRESLSPIRQRSPSSVRRRSPPPMRRRSPTPRRRRSPSPVQRRIRRRSPTPRCRSRSPLRRVSRSPPRRRSPSPPPRRRSPSPVRRRSPPPRSPIQRRRSPMRSPRQRNRSRSPYRSRSPVHRDHRSLSRDREIHTNGGGSRRGRDDYASQRVRGKRSPVRHTPEREEVELSDQERKAVDARRPPISLRSPQRDLRNRSDDNKKVPLLSSPDNSPSQSESSPNGDKGIPRDDRSQSESPVRGTRERMTRTDSASPVRQRRDHTNHRESSDTSGDEKFSHAREDGGHRSVSPRMRSRRSSIVGDKNNIPSKKFNDKESSPKRLAGDQSGEASVRRMENVDLRKKDRDRNSEKASAREERPGSSTKRLSHTEEEIEFGPRRIEDERSKLDHITDEQSGKKRSRDGSVRGDKTEAMQKPLKRVDHSREAASDSDSDSEDNEKYRSEEMEKRKHKRSDRHQMASEDDASCDSQIDAKKEAKRRRKEEKRLRKEEKRRRREERHRKREERRAGRLKAKSVDMVTSKNQNAVDDFHGDVASKRESHSSDVNEAETEQKKLEIELRKKALESLRAKKAHNP